MKQRRGNRLWAVNRALFLAALAACACSGAASPKRAPKKERRMVYVGTYTNGKSRGIYRFQLDTESGALTPMGEPTPAVNPSFLALHPSGRYLYACNEVDDFQGGGAASAFAIDSRSGELRMLNQAATRGGAPCHVSLDRAGKHLLCANYSGGSAIVFPIRPDGSLAPATAFVQHHGSSVDPSRQEAPHAHCIELDAANRHAYVADLGLDKVVIYRYDAATGALGHDGPPAGEVPPGSGPRHFAFHPNHRFAYVINEMASTVTAFACDPATGGLTSLRTVSTLPSGFNGENSTAEIVMSADGRHLYGSNRGRDSIAIFRIGDDGELTYLGETLTRGKTPRNFAIDPSGRWLLAANQESDTIAVFRVDPQTGLLAPAGSPVKAPTPVCVVFGRAQ